MKFIVPAVLYFCLCATAQIAPQAPKPPALPSLPDETVIAVFEDGTPWTMQDFKLALGGMPKEQQQMFLMNRKNFVEWWASIRKLAQMAEKEKLDQQSPTKEQIAFDRTMLLGQAMANAHLNSIAVPEEDVAKFYEANRERYKRVKVKAIYIGFGEPAPAGKKPLTEDEARQKAMGLLTQIRGGADFVKLVKENSDDATSRERDGDFGTLGAKDSFPDAIRTAVFALKQGEVTEPVRQAKGFYLLRAEEIGYTPLEQAHNEIWVELRQQMYNKWVGTIYGGAKVTYPAPAFLGEQNAPAPVPVAK